MKPLFRRRNALWEVILLTCLAVSPPAIPRAWGHGGARPLAEWGAFPPTAAYCQRITATAAAGCALQAARLRRECLDATARGTQCDEPATNAAIVRVRRDAQDLVDIHCTNNDASTIGYLDLFELQGDLVRFCREWEDISASAVYATVLPANERLDPDTYACVGATAAAAAKLSQLIFDTWRATLNRIAVRSWDLTTKTSLIDNGNDRVADIEQRMVETLQSRCGSASFEAIYHRSAATLAHDVTARANCFAPAFYVQDAVPCAAAVCGNWIKEPGESCDDGNVVGGDGCDSECLGP